MVSSTLYDVITRTVSVKYGGVTQEAREGAQSIAAHTHHAMMRRRPKIEVSAAKRPDFSTPKRWRLHSMSADHDLSTFDHEYRLHTPLVTRETGCI